MITRTDVKREYTAVIKDLSTKYPAYAQSLKSTTLSHVGSSKTALGTYNPNKHNVVIYAKRFDSVAEVQDTIRHELAHAIDYKHFGRISHGKGWKSLAIKFGATPRATTLMRHEAMENIDYKYKIMLEGKMVKGYFRKPKWASRVSECSVGGRPETLGKLTIVQMF